jgi:hypothetical protein
MLLSYGIGYFIGKMVEGKNLEKHFYNAKAKEISDEVDNMVVAEMVRLAKEVPAELLANGNKEKVLHIAGIKEAPIETQREWANDRRVMEETKAEASMENLLSKLNPDDMKLKAGIKKHDRNKGTDDLTKKIQSLVKMDDTDEVELTKRKVRAARKQAEKDLEVKSQIDFEALNFSRISNEARKQISEIVKKDLENKLSAVPEIEGGLGE